MPTITINGVPCDFEQGESILQVALAHHIEIPHYCYHSSLSVVASCRICLVEVWAPNPRNDNALERIPKLLPACQTPAGDGQKAFTDTPMAIANQKAVMEYLLINHPVDCPVCDQAGECLLQDYSYQFGRGQARFQEEKIKQPKKDIGPHVLLYSDRCIMCTRCVRFTREITGTGELIVDGRGAYEQIDLFPGLALENELSANVVDLCPVGALLDKDFLFQQRVWFLKHTPSIDPLTCSGDNLWIEHNDNIVHRLKPRGNEEVNPHWITDEVRYGWTWLHDEARPALPVVEGETAFEPVEAPVAYETAYAKTLKVLDEASRIVLIVSPMLSCEDAYVWARFVSSLEKEVIFAIGPVPVEGKDKTFLDGYTMYAEKAPNARGVRRVLERFHGKLIEHPAALDVLKKDKGVDAVICTGNYLSEWVTDELTRAVGDRPLVMLDTRTSALSDKAQVFIPTAMWAEKAGTFENVNHRLQAFDRAIDPLDYVKSEAQIALDLEALRAGETPVVFNPAMIRQAMAADHDLTAFTAELHLPRADQKPEMDMEMVEL